MRLIITPLERCFGSTWPVITDYTPGEVKLDGAPQGLRLKIKDSRRSSVPPLCAEFPHFIEPYFVIGSIQYAAAELLDLLRL